MSDAVAGQADSPQRSRRRLAHDHVRGPLLELHQIRGEAGRHRPLLVRVEAQDEGPHHPQPFLEGEPRVPLAPGVSRQRPQRAPGDADRRRSSAVGVEPSGRRDGVEECQPQGGSHRGRPRLELDAVEDGAQTDQLPGRVQLEELVGQAVLRRRVGRGVGAVTGRGTVRRGEPFAEAVPNGIGQIRECGEGQVLGRGFGVAQLRAAELLLARNAFELAPGRSLHGSGWRLRAAPLCRRRGFAAPGAGLPDERFEDDRPTADGAIAGEELFDGGLHGAAAEGPDRDRQARGVEMAHIGRTHHDVSQDSRQGQRFEVGGATLRGDCRSGDPAATAVQIEDDFPRLCPRLDLGGDVGHGGRRGEVVEDRQQRAAFVAPLGAVGDGAPDHGPIVTDAWRAGIAGCAAKTVVASDDAAAIDPGRGPPAAALGPGRAA